MAESVAVALALLRRVRKLRADTLERMAKGGEHRAYDELVGRAKAFTEVEIILVDTKDKITGGDFDE